MTDESSNIGMPCKNPSCKSFGKSHPNCKCYANMAEGGDASEFCSSNQEHDPDCPFFLNEDPVKSVAAYLAHQGATGFLNKNLNADLEKYHTSIDKGHKRIDDSAKSLFSDKSTPDYTNPKGKKDLEDWINKGAVYEDIQNAISGQNPDPKNPVQTSNLEEVHPQQNLLLQSAKGRISSYLNAMKPQPFTPKLAFDDPPDQTKQIKDYNEALDIATNPLGVLNKIKSGEIEALHVKHFNAMYPELNDVLQKKLTEKITEAQLKDEKPDHITRQGLSLFMGTNLSGEYQPQNIQAAQSVFQQQQPQTEQAPISKSKPKKNTSKLSKSDEAFLTNNQALATRQQKQ